MSLSFAGLREANIARLSYFPHSRNWTPEQWFLAFVGEVGEFANLLKKVNRGDISLDDAHESLGRELADAQIYLEALARSLNINLGAATASKWNEVSRRIGCPLRIETFR